MGPYQKLTIVGTIIKLTCPNMNLTQKTNNGKSKGLKKNTGLVLKNISIC